jgi:hypothetical protein
MEPRVSIPVACRTRRNKVQRCSDTATLARNRASNPAGGDQQKVHVPWIALPSRATQQDVARRSLQKRRSPEIKDLTH